MANILLLAIRRNVFQLSPGLSGKPTERVEEPTVVRHLFLGRPTHRPFWNNGSLTLDLPYSVTYSVPLQPSNKHIYGSHAETQLVFLDFLRLPFIDDTAETGAIEDLEPLQ